MILGAIGKVACFQLEAGGFVARCSNVENNRKNLKGFQISHSCRTSLLYKTTPLKRLDWQYLEEHKGFC